MMPRDLSALRKPDNCCVICGLCVCEEYSIARCAATHLADGTAVVEKAYGKPDRVVPTSSLPYTSAPKVNGGTVYIPLPRGPSRPKTKLPPTARSVYVKSFRPKETP